MLEQRLFIVGLLVPTIGVAVLLGCESAPQAVSQSNLALAFDDDDDDDDDDDSHAAGELVVVTNSPLEFVDPGECQFVVRGMARKANGDDLYVIDYCSKSTVSLPPGCKLCMDVDEFVITIRAEDGTSMVAEVVDIAGVPDDALLNALALEVSMKGSPGAASWEGRGFFTWAAMLGVIDEATGGFENFLGGQTYLSGNLEFADGVFRSNGFIQFVAPPGGDEDD